MWKKVKTAMHFMHWPMIIGMMSVALVASAGAAAAVTPAFQAAAARGSTMQISIPNILASIPDAGWTMLEGLKELPQVCEGVANAAEAGELWNYDYTWGLMDHSAAGHDMVASAGEHGGDALSGLSAEHNHASAGHDVSKTPNVNEDLLSELSPDVPELSQDALDLLQ